MLFCRFCRKEREERRRLRTRELHLVECDFDPVSDSLNRRAVRFLSNSTPGAVREPDTESDEEVDGKQLRSTKKLAEGVTPPKIAG